MWSDQSGGQERHVAAAAALMPDPRARHYWDGGRVAGRAYPTLALDDVVVRLNVEAWDVWLLFDASATWTAAAAPEPAWWEHQVRGMPDERRLDARRFAAKALELRPPGSAAVKRRER